MNAVSPVRGMPRIRPPRRQRGAAIILVTVGLVALLAVIGLAIDTGHLTYNKSQLQNAVDAAALAGAKVLDQTGSTTQASTAARSVFTGNSSRNREMSAVLSGADINIQYSATLAPFQPGTTPAQYVRVTAQGFTMWSSLAAMVGVDRLTTAASAVAGPSPRVLQACNLAPMMVCGNPAAGAANNWGFPINQLKILKIGSNTASPIGPGNFQLVRLPDANGTPQPGAADLRQNMAGGAQGCATIGSSLTIDTQPGNLTGPVAQGLNTRMGIYQGPLAGSQTTYPPDVVTYPNNSQPLSYNTNTGAITLNGSTVTTASQIPQYNHSAYLNRMANGPQDFPTTGVPLRRELVLPVGDCTGVNNGQSTLPILGLACFFMIQRVQQGSQGGGGGSGGEVVGQFLGNCTTGGTPGPTPGTGPGPYVIQLYRDARSADS